MQLLNGSHQAHMVMNTQTPYQHPCFAPLFYVGRLKRPLKHMMEHWGGMLIGGTSHHVLQRTWERSAEY